MSKITGVYLITNTINGHKYVGSAVDMKSRWALHIAMLNKNIHHSRYLQRAWDKYGSNSFSFSILMECGREDLLITEQSYIDKMMPEYNIARVAGSALGIKHTLESRENMSKAAVGKVMSPETRKKMSNTAKSIMTDDKRSKVSKFMKGNKYALGSVQSDDAKKKIGAASKGNKYRLGIKHSEESKKRMSEILKGNKRSLGYKHPKEFSDKQSERMKGNNWNVGHKASQETKDKMSASAKLHWANKKKEEINND